MIAGFAPLATKISGVVRISPDLRPLVVSNRIGASFQM
jgi:hypothetical protein